MRARGLAAAGGLALAVASWAGSEARHVASGSFEVAEVGEDSVRLSVVQALRGELTAALAGALPAEVQLVDGKARPSAALATDAGGEPAYFLWVSRPLVGVASLTERLAVRPARAELEVAWVASPEADGAEKPARPRRWFSLWALPAPQPLLLASTELTRPDGSHARERYLGPPGGFADPERGWARAGTAILRPPPQVMPGLLRAVVEAQTRGRPVAFEIVAQGFDSGPILRPDRRILRSPGEVVREWERLHAWAVPKPPRPDFDPAQHLIVALYAGVVSPPATAPRATGVFERPGGELVVELDSGEGDLGLAPTIDEGDGQVDRSPFVWLRIERKATSRVEIVPAQP